MLTMYRIIHHNIVHLCVCVCVYVCLSMCVQWNPSNPDTLGPESTVLIIEVSSFQGWRCTVAYYSGIFGSSGMCPL